MAYQRSEKKFHPIQCSFFYIASCKAKREGINTEKLPPSISELKNRLEKRGQDTHDIVKKRMKKSWDEISHWAGYDYVVINDDLDKTEAKLKSIVAAERLRRSQQPGLLDHVRTLQTEFEKHNDL